MGGHLYKVIDTPLSLDKAYQHVTRKDCGGVIVFLGTVRNHNQGKQVLGINYSAFKEMAEKEFARIGQEATQKWPIKQVAILHRVGQLKPGDISVLIAISSLHRNEAFEACRFAIEQLKKLAPIWKEEIYQEGKSWITS